MSGIQPDGPQTVADWRQYLHVALEAYHANPQDQEAFREAQKALLKINALNVGGNMADANAVEHTSTAASLLGGALHGASLGTGEVFAGLGSAAQGKGFRSGAQNYRESLGALEASHPILTPTAELGAGFALPAAQIGKTAAQTIRAGVPLGVRGALRLVGRGATSGAVPGAVAGFSQGGEDPGDLGARLRGAATGGLAGGALGATGAGLAARFARRSAESAADLAARGATRETQAVNLDNAKLRNAILRRRAAPKVPERPISNGPVDDIGQALADYKAGRISEDDLNTALSFATRGAEPRAQQLPIRGTVAASAPPEVPPTAVMARALEQTPRPGTHAPGGGRYVEPGPYQKAGPGVRVQSPRAPSDLPGRQVQLLLDELKNVPRAELPGRLQSLKDLGILTEQQVAEILAGAPQAATRAAHPSAANAGRMATVKSGGHTYEIPEMWLVGRKQALAREGVPFAEQTQRAIQDWIDQGPP